MTMDEYVIMLKSEMERQGISQMELSRRTGIPTSTMQKIFLRITKMPKKETLDRINAVMKIDGIEMDAHSNRVSETVKHLFEDENIDLNDILNALDDSIRQLDETKSKLESIRILLTNR